MDRPCGGALSRRREVDLRFGQEEKTQHEGPREVSAQMLQAKADAVRALLEEYRAAKNLLENVEAEDMVLQVGGRQNPAAESSC